MATRQVVRYIRKRPEDGGRGAAKQRERIIQRNITRWLNNEHSSIDFYNDWSAGAFLTHGQNTARAAMASDNGWVDMFFPEPRNGHCGLFIELKKEGVRVYLKDGVTLCADPQIQKEGEFLRRQRQKGYKAEFAVGEEATKRLICEYMGWPWLENTELF